MGEPAFHLDADLNPIGMSMGCSSRLGPPFLGTDASFLLCGLLDGHDGPHLFHAEWDDEAALIEHPGRVHMPFTDDGVTYCGYDGRDGCGEVWPCKTVRDSGHAETPPKPAEYGSDRADGAS